jgi:hypothetical protein
MLGGPVRLTDGGPAVQAGDLGPLYERVAQRLGVPPDHLNLEGAGRHGATVRWFNRGNLAGQPRLAALDPTTGQVIRASKATTDRSERPDPASWCTWTSRNWPASPTVVAGARRAAPQAAPPPAPEPAWPEAALTVEPHHRSSGRLLVSVDARDAVPTATVLDAAARPRACWSVAL